MLGAVTVGFFRVLVSVAQTMVEASRSSRDELALLPALPLISDTVRNVNALPLCPEPLVPQAARTSSARAGHGSPVAHERTRSTFTWGPSLSRRGSGPGRGRLVRGGGRLDNLGLEDAGMVPEVLLQL